MSWIYSKNTTCIKMVHLQDSLCFSVKLDRVNTETMLPLLKLLGHMGEGLLIVQKLDCKFYYLRNIKMNLTNILVGETLSEVNTEYIVSSYRTRRDVVISKDSTQMMLITDDYRLALLTSAIHNIHRNGMIHGVCQLYLASDGAWTGRMISDKACTGHTTSAATCSVNLTSDETWTDSMNPDGTWTGRIASGETRTGHMALSKAWTGHMRPYSNGKHNSRKNMHPVMIPELRRMRTKHLPKRKSHHTTPIYPSPDETIRLDKSEILGKKCNPSLDHVYPLPGPSQYNNPLLRGSRRYEDNVKLSIEATDPSLDGYRSNIAPSTSPTARPFKGLSSSNTELVTNVSGFRRERGASSQSVEHAATGYDDTFPRHVRSETSVSAYGIQRNNIKPPRHPQYAPLSARLESYIIYGWTERTKPVASALAGSGLFATGAGDLVRCFQCGLGLKDWVKDDDPLTEHVKHATECDFLVETLGIDQLRRFKDAVSTSPSNVVNTTGTQSGLPRPVTSTSLPYPVRNPRYITMEDRVASFICFPRHITQSPRELALAGLFFTGEDDICRCFTCDGGLKNWVPGDDPIEEHAKYFPQCPYLRHLKGDSFVELVQRRMQSTSETVSSPIPRPTSQPNVASVAEPLSQQLFRGAREANARLQSTAARSVLEMGYSEDVVFRAMTQLQTRGEAMPTAQQLMELILSYEDNGELPTVPGSGTEFNATIAQTGDLDLMSENERLKAGMKCVICHTAERNVLCIPCSHLRMCTECAKHVNNCPECGRHIETKIKTFMS